MRVRIHAMGEYGSNGLHDVAKIRVHHPLSLLSSISDYSLSYGPDWKGAMNADIFYVERCWRTCMSNIEVFDFINYVKLTRKKLVYELDDNLLDHPQITAMQKSNVRMLAASADLVIVTTDSLRTRMQALNSRIVIIPNFLSTTNIGSNPRRKIETPRIVIGYMGTYTHQEDFQMIKLPLQRILTEFRDSVQLEIIGAAQDLGRFSDMANVRVHDIQGRSAYNDFWEWMMSSIFWDVGLGPLQQDSFTICKSDIKYLDYAALGCCGVFSDCPPYRATVRDGITGLLVPDSADAWYQRLSELIVHRNMRERIARCASADLYETRLLEKNISLWKDALDSVCGGTDAGIHSGKVTSPV